jgi:hypothetical protein
MVRLTFYRNVHARDHLDLFLVSAISSLLLLRFYLYLAGYPQVGGGTLHIAHMLWGGILMLVAITINLSFIGNRVLQISAFVGGIGFGVFIDELGKFITKDNNYFFRPTIGIIYAVFILLYLSFNFLSRKQRLSSKEYQLNALLNLEEAVALDMDERERARVAALLKNADQNSPITKQLQQLLASIKPVPDSKPDSLQRLSLWVSALYTRFWTLRRSNTYVQSVLVAAVLVLCAGIVATIYANVDDVMSLLAGAATYDRVLLLGQIISALISIIFVVVGIVQLPKSHIHALEQFRRAALINLFLTEFFMFTREQFAAILPFIGNLLFLIIVTTVIEQERRLASRDAE